MIVFLTISALFVVLLATVVCLAVRDEYRSMRRSMESANSCYKDILASREEWSRKNRELENDLYVSSKRVRELECELERFGEFYEAMKTAEANLKGDEE